MGQACRGCNSDSNYEQQLRLAAHELYLGRCSYMQVLYKESLLGRVVVLGFGQLVAVPVSFSFRSRSCISGCSSCRRWRLLCYACD